MRSSFQEKQPVTHELEKHTGSNTGSKIKLCGTLGKKYKNTTNNKKVVILYSTVSSNSKKKIEGRHASREKSKKKDLETASASDRFSGIGSKKCVTQPPSRDTSKDRNESPGACSNLSKVIEIQNQISQNRTKQQQLITVVKDRSR